MSRTCGITFELEMTQHSRLDIILLLVEHGWRFDGLYLPPNDHGMFDWQDAPAPQWPQVCAILTQIDDANEPIGVSLQWQDTGIGGTFHIDSLTTSSVNQRLWTIWSAERPRLIATYWFTDHSWYLKQILPAFWQADVFIRSVECRDVY